MSEVPEDPDPRPQRYYFGENWGAPALDDAVQMPIPIDDPCLMCGQPIAEGDQGLFMPYLADNATVVGLRPQHLECLVRSTIGSPAHVRGECSCFGHQEPEDDRSWYDQGREVMTLIENGVTLESMANRFPGSETQPD